MTDIILWNNIPAEIWNQIAFFTTHNEVSLIQFLVFYLKLGKFRLDIQKLKEIYKRNLAYRGAIILMGAIENDNIWGSFLPYEALYPSSMISENIAHGDYIRDKNNSLIPYQDGYLYQTNKK